MTNSRSTVWALRFAALAFVVAQACGGSMPVKRRYTLVNEYTESGGSAATPLCDRPLAITVGSPPEAPYDTDKIAFRTDAYEVKYYNYRVWVGPPIDMLVSLISRKVEKARLFNGVESLVHSAGGHLTLYVRLHAIEKLELGKRHSARLAMSFTLKAPDDEETLWSYEFDETRDAQGKGIPALLEALNRTYNVKIDAMIGSLAAAVSNGEFCGRLDKVGADRRPASPISHQNDRRPTVARVGPQGLKERREPVRVEEFR